LPRRGIQGSAAKDYDWLPSNTTVVDSSDVLSDVLRGARLRSRGAQEVRFTAPWDIGVGADEAWFYFVLQGRCWLEADDHASAVPLAAGDLIVAVQGCGHRLCDRLHGPAVATEPTDASARTRPGASGASDGVGAVTRLIRGRFHFEERGLGALLASLPPWLHVQGTRGNGCPWLADTLQMMVHESGASRPGSQAIVEHLTQVVVIHAVRSHILTRSDGIGGWLAAVGDPDIGPVLGLMHTQPERPWTVAALADQVCLSRSVFAARFKALVSKPPLQYLLECRMQKACTLLVEDRCGIKEIALQVGYATEAAFSNAFKRWSGLSPRAYRQVARGGRTLSRLGTTPP
jgi:AraC-like DNA-binding protein